MHDSWDIDLLVRNLFSRAPLAYTTPDEQILKAKHELAELAQATTWDEKKKEVADILVCLAGMVAKEGHSWSEVSEALAEKLEININRTWTRQPDGTYQHD